MSAKKPNHVDVGRPPHNGKLGLLGVSLTEARLNRHSMTALKSVRDELEQIMVESRYLDGAPFVWVTIAIRYGLKYDEKPHYERINKKYGDLPLSIEVDTHDLIGAPVEQAIQIIRRAALLSLIHAGLKYRRPVERLEAELYATPKA